MLLTPRTLSAAGDSPWLIPGPLPRASYLGLALTFSYNANLTANVEYTYDDPMQTPRAVTLARAGAVLTVTDVAHGLNVGDAILLSNDESDPNNIWDLSPAAGQAGTNYDLASVPSADTYTVAVANAGSAAGTGFVRSFKLFTHKTLSAISGSPPARTDGYLNWPVGAIRLNVTGYTAGSATLTVQQPAGT